LYDFGVEGGVVVTGRGRARLNVYVDDGRIAAIASDRRPARDVVEADGLLVMPGMVDVHVHLMDPGDPTRETFPDGTAAAALAGVTTIVEHTHGRPVRTAAELAEKRDYLAGRSHVDFGLGAHAWPDLLDEVEGVWRAGAAFIKLFTCTTHGVPGLDAGLQLDLFRRVAACDGVCLVHCEDESITAAAERRLRAEGRADGAVVFEWRSRDAEQVAVAVTARLARLTGAEVVVAHVSHAEALELVVRERAAGARVSAECCPQYLSLLESEVVEELGFRKFTPPARARSLAELERMWRALAEGEVEYVATDHAPSTAGQKRAGSIWEVHFGLPGIDTTLPFFLDGARAGRIGYERVVEAYAERPARRYRLARKGRLEPGADADLVLVDPEARWEVADGDIRSRAGWSPFSGRTFVGRAVRTYLRGRAVAVDGALAGEPAGAFVPGAGARNQ
jgi:dihydroorotase (multifunctional complex type)